MSARHDGRTLYLGAPEVARIVARKGLAPLLGEVEDRLRQDYLRWHEFDKTARVAHHSADGVIELMPVSDAALYAFKYVNGHPKNTRQGLPTVMAFGVLADVATGAPRLLSELTLATAIRTAAMSALAALTLARADSATMALIGNGAQAEFQAIAFVERLGIDTLRLHDTDPMATAKLIDNLRHHFGPRRVRLVACRSTAEAVHGADIVTTVTADKTRATILTPDLIEPGMHLNAVGGDCPGKTELHADVLRGASVFVEYEPQTRIEGDLQQMPPDFAVTELWQVLAAQRPGRRHRQEVTVFDSVGFALEDYAVLCVLEAAALELGIGDRALLVPQMADPKNLFGVLRAEACVQAPGAALGRGPSTREAVALSTGPRADQALVQA